MDPRINWTPVRRNARRLGLRRGARGSGCRAGTDRLDRPNVGVELQKTGLSGKQPNGLGKFRQGMREFSFQKEEP